MPIKLNNIGNGNIVPKDSLKVTAKQSTKDFKNKNLKSADGWRDGREEEEEEEWLVTFRTVLAMAVS